MAVYDHHHWVNDMYQGSLYMEHNWTKTIYPT